MRKNTKNCFLGAALIMALSQSSSHGVERSFDAVVVSVNPAEQVLRVRHKPTGFEADMKWNDKTSFSAREWYDWDEIADGTLVDITLGQHDPKKQVLQVSNIAMADPKKVPTTHPQPLGWQKHVSGKLRRVPGDYSKGRRDLFLTQDKKAAYVLDLDGQNWQLTLRAVRRMLEREVKMTPAELKPGLPLETVRYEENPAGNVAEAIRGLFNLRDAEDLPTGSTGTTVADLSKFDDMLKRVRERFDWDNGKLGAELRKLMPVQMRVEPELAFESEPMRLRIEAWAAKSPNPSVKLETNYLKATPGPTQELKLDWKAGEQKQGLTLYTAELPLPKLPVGQHVVSWKCDIGGDTEEYYRSFAVTGPHSMVAMLHFTGGSPNEEYYTYRLPFDYWEDKMMEMRHNIHTPEQVAVWSKNHRQRGAMPGFWLNSGIYSGFSGDMVRPPALAGRDPSVVQTAYFKLIRGFATMVGYPADVGGFVSYELGTQSISALQQANEHLLVSLCDYQNWKDGQWEINLVGRPLRPYFVSEEDYRKPGPRRENSVVAVSQDTKSILRKDYMYATYEPSWIEMAWVGGGGGGREKVYDEIFLSRHLDVFDGQVQNLKNQKVPFFMDLGIEFSTLPGKRDETTIPNSILINYVVKKARTEDIVFANQDAAAAFLKRHYGEIPETVDYEPDYWCGLKAFQSIRSSWKPVDYPDQIQIENPRYSAIFHKPDVLPQFHYDFMKKWEFPDWGNEDQPRSTWGALVPGEHDKWAVTPKTTDTRPMKVSEVRKEVGDGLEITITLESAEEQKVLGLALWDIPREWREGDGWYAVEGAARFVPVRAFYTGNLCGVLEVQAKPGLNTYKVLINTPKRTPQSLDIAVEGVRGKVFERDGQSMAYVWPTRPWETTFELTVPPGKSVQYYAAPKGEKVDLPAGIHKLVIEQERWARIVGLSREELVANLKEAK
jgi:hypothetical protein